jgi:2-dehydro-3-deoxygluconokinase
MPRETRDCIVTFGEVMLRLKTPGHQRFAQASSFEATYGGGEANVAASLSSLGLASRFLSRVPEGDLGDGCLSFLRGLGVDVSLVARGGERLGIYFLESGASQRGSKVIYDRAGSALATVGRGMVPWAEGFRDAAWFHWTGITPALSEGAAEAVSEGIQAARAAGLTVSCDLNYRGKLWRWGKSAGQVMAELVAGAEVAVANEEDAEKVFGIRAPGAQVEAGRIDSRSYRQVGQELARRFPRLRRIGFTLRKSLGASHNLWSGALYSPKDDELLSAREYSIAPIVDRVGGGDAFAAGLIYGFRRFGEEPEGRRRALEFATAASCLKHTIPGDINLAPACEVEALLAGGGSGRIER